MLQQLKVELVFAMLQNIVLHKIKLREFKPMETISQQVKQYLELEQNGLGRFIPLLNSTCDAFQVAVGLMIEVNGNLRELHL